MGESEARGDFATAIRLQERDGGGLVADLPSSFSLAPLVLDPLGGNAHGGLVAALAVVAARQALAIEAPLRTLSLQFLAGAKFGPLNLEAELTRGGRTTQYAGVRGRQHSAVFEARLTFGVDGRSADHRPSTMPTAPEPDVSAGLLAPPQFQPRFTQHAQYHPLTGRAFGGGEPRLLLWMREASGAPLDVVRLCFLLDAIYPAFYATLEQPVPAASVDLRYDFTGAVSAADAPDGWVLFEFHTRDLAQGWAIEDGSAWSRARRLLAVARQLRKTLAPPM